MARFINHSCEPNCKLEIVMRRKNDSLALGVFAKKTIPPNTQITIDYGWMTPNENFTNIPCKCGSKNCHKFLYFDKTINKNSDYLQKTLQPTNSKKDRTAYIGNGMYYFYYLQLFTN